MVGHALMVAKEIIYHEYADIAHPGAIDIGHLWSTDNSQPRTIDICHKGDILDSRIYA